MNRIFDIRRFSNYLVYDLNNARNNFGFSMLIMGLAPVILFAVIEVTSLIFSGHSGDMTDGTLSKTVLTIVFIATFFVFPRKAYGPLTQKRSGSFWLMLPASSFEKWLSTVIVSCVVVPMVLIAMFAVCECILWGIFPGIYGSPVVFGWLKSFGQLFLSSFFVMLCFVLGTFFFDGNANAKTFLCLIVLSLLTMIFTGLTGGIADTIRLMVDSGMPDNIDEGAIEEIARRSISSATIAFAVEITAALYGLFRVIKTKKF